jgi:hypothetical protein
VTIQAWFDGLSTASHSSEWISGLTGAGGAILGSVVTVIWTELFNRRTRSRDRKSRNAAGAFAAYQRLNQIYSNALVVKQHLDGSMAYAIVSRSPFFCMQVVPMNRLPGPVSFPVDELWTLAQVGGHTLINRVNSLDHAYNSLAEMMDHFRDARIATWNQIVPERMNGTTGTVAMTPEVFKAMMPRFAELDSAITQIKPIADSLVADAFEALELLVHAKAKPLGKTFKLSLPRADGGVAIIQANEKRKRLAGK